MKYRELIEFEPIVSVKQLRAGGEEKSAAEDVGSYVISEAMRDVLVDLVIPQLRFDNPDVDHKGLLLVATYGTGKTHLMSAIAGVADHAPLASSLTDSETAVAAESIAGKFKVVRIEIGAVRMGLRDLLTREMSEALKRMGVSYEFAPLDQVTNNKDSLAEMMSAFADSFPEHGLLIVIDELLDYLRTRKDTELILDLGFLREMGEFCQGSRFRIIAGVQETLWDNPRFALAQDEVRRMRERYSQFRISRDDVAYVVQKRLLNKTPSQRDQVMAHLTKFAPAFESLGADLDTFVDLFPVHPAYLRTFENLTIVEKRRILETLSAEMRSRLDDDVPTKSPGLICFDEYRGDLDADPSNKVSPQVKEILDRCRVLRERVERGLRTRTDVEPALRIIDALAVHRLTTGDLDAPIGLTAEELRDDLCLLPPGTPELDPAFIASSIETIVDEIQLAVSGQFLSVNDLNGQVYIDLKKSVDYEQQIEERAATLEPEDLDSAYYQAMERVLEVNDDPYVSGYRIWQYELPWVTHKVARLGYLFMGAPNERSTAQPPRDFYLYFLQPYAPTSYTDDNRPDEVLLRLVQPDETFTTALRRYAGAARKATETTTQHRAAFEQRRDVYLNEMVQWLRKNMATHMAVKYRGEEKRFGEWLAGATGTRRSVKDQVDAIAAHVLEDHFEARYPGYPKFADEVTRTNLAPTVQAALQQVSGRRGTSLSRMALSGLQLLDINGEISVDGPYAEELLSRIAAAKGKAVNRADLLEERDLGVWTWGPWHLEPAWLVVVAASLVYLGKAEIGMPSGTVGATQLDRLADMPLVELERVSHVVPPAGMDVDRLRRVAKMVGVVPGKITDTLDNNVVIELISKSTELHTKATDAKVLIQENRRLWGEELFDDPSQRIKRITDLISVTADIKERTTAGKMRHLTLDDEALTAAEIGTRELNRTQNSKAVYDRLVDTVQYLASAGDTLGDSDPLASVAVSLRSEVRSLIRSENIDMTAATVIHTEADQLKGQYRRIAIECHERDRLSAAGDSKKQTLVTGDTWRDVGMLSQISIIPEGRFASLESKLAMVGTCKTFKQSYFDQEFTCPDCKYRPAMSSGPTAEATVIALTAEAERMRIEFLDAIADSLTEPELQDGIDYLKDSDQAAIRDFIKTKRPPSSGVTQDFVTAVNELLQRFEIRRVTSAELWAAVMGGSTPITPDELAHRFGTWLDDTVVSGVDRTRVRIIPTDGTSE